MQNIFVPPLPALLLFLVTNLAWSELVEYELEIDESSVNFTGQSVEAITVNGSIPGPTLEANVGDTLRVTFNNRLNTPSSIHWHGVLLPNDQDGVPYLTTQPIAANSSFTYEFPITHHGTYWYHSHWGFQEQRGVYGALVFHPEVEKVLADQEQVLLFSDWTDEDPQQVLRNMKRDHDYYGIKKDSVQSWDRVIEQGKQAVINRLNANWIRMGPMDISDVGYDAFLVNGQEQIELSNLPSGKTMRLRLVNASGSSYFHIRFAGGPMQVVAADGVDVEPLNVEELMIATAETYDVIVQLPNDRTYELRATANDGTGYSSVWIGGGAERVSAQNFQPDNLYLMSHSSHDMSSMGQSDMDMPELGLGSEAMDHSGMDHSGMDHSSMGHESMEMTGMMPSDVDATVQKSLGQYENLRALQPTSFDSALPRRDVLLRLTGTMDGYRWQFNDMPLSAADRILIKRGEVVRFELKNETMMSHPIHLHGHFFRVLTAAGEYSPLKHTVNVPPLQTVVIEFEADEEKDWIFHCHNLYHMMTGMTRIVRYDDFQGDASLPSTMGATAMSEDARYWSFADLGLHSNFSELMLRSFNNSHEWLVELEADWDNTVEADIQYKHRLGNFAQVFAGFDIENTDLEDESLTVAGFHYLLPGLIESEWRVDSEGEFRLQLEAGISLTPRIDAEWIWNTDDEYRVGLVYELSKQIALTALTDSDFDAGLGIEIRF